MKKLMFICSLAFTFLLGVQEMSAQYVPTDQAATIVRNEISTLQQVTPVVTTSSFASTPPQVSIDVRLKEAFLGLVLEGLTSQNAEVQAAIDFASNSMAVNVDANKNAMVEEVKKFTEDLLAD
ncbi:MAG: hypothetical protein P8N29_01230 [Saprospiraceae bacterium]|jgi:hypothetical protein|nr:hypothetical protein [Saprospiraceae bacterium]